MEQRVEQAQTVLALLRPGFLRARTAIGRTTSARTKARAGGARWTARSGPGRRAGRDAARSAPPNLALAPRDRPSPVDGGAGRDRRRGGGAPFGPQLAPAARYWARRPPRRWRCTSGCWYRPSRRAPRRPPCRLASRSVRRALSRRRRPATRATARSAWPTRCWRRPTTPLLVTGWVIGMEAIWEDPAYAVHRAVGSMFRVILWDKRGTGCRTGSRSTGCRRSSAWTARCSTPPAPAAAAGMSEGGVLAALLSRPPSADAGAGALAPNAGAARSATSCHAMPVRSRFDEFADQVQRSWDDMGRFLALWALTHEHDPPCARVVDAASHRGASRRPRSLATDDRRFDIRGVKWRHPLAHVIPPFRRPDDRGRERPLAPPTSPAPAIRAVGGRPPWWLGDRRAARRLERFVGALPAQPRSRPRDGALHGRRRLQRAPPSSATPLARPHGAPRGVVRDRPAPSAATRGQDDRGRVRVDLRRPARADAAPLRPRRRPRWGSSYAAAAYREVEVVDDDVHGIAVAITARVASIAVPLGGVPCRARTRPRVAGSGISQPRPRHPRAQGRRGRLAALRAIPGRSFRPRGRRRARRRRRRGAC